MDCRFSFKQIQKSDVLVNFIQPKIVAKVEKYSTKPIDAHITISKQTFNYTVHCTIKGGDGFNSQVEATNPDIHNAIDIMLDRLEVQLKKQKEKLKRHKHPEGRGIRHLRLVSNDVLTDDWESLPIDAEDIVKYEHARHSG